MQSKSREFKIWNRMVGDGHPAFIVAELSGNHHQNYDEAVALVKAAKEAGADAVKLQTYTADTITLNSDKEWFVVKGKDQPDIWKKRTLYDLYTKGNTPWDWQPKLKKLADELGIILFSSPFDDTAVDFLEKLDVPCYKIASYEAIHIPLLEKVAKTKKPVIMSIGFASLDEATLAVETLRKNGSGDIAVLHCITAYSDKPKFEDSNLKTIADIKNRFGVVAGFSDNNAGIEIPVLAVAAGASIIEKHFILDRKSGGPDARFSIEPAELKNMVMMIRKFEKDSARALEGFVIKENAEKAMGHPQYDSASEQERENEFFRPTLWVKKDIKKGEIFTKENTRVARPSSGLNSKHWKDILGREAERDIEAATPLSWDLVKA